MSFATSQPALSATGVGVRLGGVTVIEEADLTLHAGDLVLLTGPNGAGKSTLLKSVLGLLTPRSGRALLLGDSPHRTRHRVGYVPQRSSVDWDFPADAQTVVTMGLYRGLGPFRRPGRRERERAMQALETVGMGHLAKRQIGRLSGGQQQRVFLARALVQEAELYLLDEPFAGVDAASEAALVEVLRRLNAQGATVVAVHHDLTTLASYFDWIALLNVRLFAQGPLAATLTPEALQAAYGGRLPLLATLAPEEVRRAV